MFNEKSPACQRAMPKKSLADRRLVWQFRRLMAKTINENGNSSTVDSCLHLIEFLEVLV